MRSLRTREKYLKEKSSRAYNLDLQGLFLLPSDQRDLVSLISIYLSISWRISCFYTPSEPSYGLLSASLASIDVLREETGNRSCSSGSAAWSYSAETNKKRSLWKKCERIKNDELMIAGLLENSIEEWETSLENNKVLGMKRENIMITRSIRQN